MQTWWITPLVTVLACLFGFAVQWGIFKAGMDALDRRLDGIEKGMHSLWNKMSNTREQLMAMKGRSSASDPDSDGDK